MFTEQHPRYTRYTSSLADERTQWKSTRACLLTLTNDYLRESRSFSTKSQQLIKENQNDPNLVDFFYQRWENFTALINYFLSLAPAIRMRKLNIDPRTKIGKCPTCRGEGYTEKPSEWCETCGGWGYAVKSIFEYVDCPEPPGIVVYFVKNEVVVNYLTFGKKVTVEI